MVDATITLQLIGIVALGSFAGELNRTTKVEGDLSVIKFIGAMIGSAFLSFWVAYGIYAYREDRAAAFIAAGILSYQEEAIVLKYGVNAIKKLPKIFSGGEDDE